MSTNGYRPDKQSVHIYQETGNRGEYAPRSHVARGGAPQRKKKIRFRPNKDGMLALLALVLIVAIVITLLVLTIKAIVGAVRGGEETTAESTTESTPEPPPVATWHDGYVNKSVSSSDIEVGNLVLVNFEHAYGLADSSSLRLSQLYGATGYGSTYVLGRSDTKVRSEIMAPLREMLNALIDACDTLGRTSQDDRVIISGGHRTTKYQEDLYNKQTEANYVAAPGYSEHHTGLAVDLKVFNSAGNTSTVDFRDNEQAWMEQNCAKYGFVVRYDGAKFETTGILDETWHYRYVGVPHATYMTEHNLCLEEYLELLKKSYAYEASEPLTITTEENEYLVYYVPASSDSTTFIPVPPESVGTYEISGNNVDGFIVTITKK